MGKRRADKEAIVAALRESLGKSEGVLFADYRGLKVSELTELRHRLRQAGAQFQVVKNTLTRLAVRGLGLEAAERYLVGPTAVALADKDVAAPARVLQEFARDHKALEIKGGLLGTQVLSLEEIKTLAELPPRDELLARVLGSLQSPLVGAAGVLQGLLRNL
ncbi:MAG: 50S ribosomal protein L10, partial [Clostridia bacterium]|nr:50S ribosomal protein L10 [Clostridia bacterium]